MARSGDRNKAIVEAYATGAYTCREIAQYFGIHLAIVGRAVRRAMQRCETFLPETLLTTDAAHYESLLPFHSTQRFPR